MSKYDVWFFEMKPAYTWNKSMMGYTRNSQEYLGEYFASSEKEAEEQASKDTEKKGVFEAELIF